MGGTGICWYRVTAHIVTLEQMKRQQNVAKTFFSVLDTNDERNDSFIELSGFQSESNWSSQDDMDYRLKIDNAERYDNVRLAFSTGAIVLMLLLITIVYFTKSGFQL